MADANMKKDTRQAEDVEEMTLSMQKNNGSGGPREAFSRDEFEKYIEAVDKAYGGSKNFRLHTDEEIKYFIGQKGWGKGDCTDV